MVALEYRPVALGICFLLDVRRCRRIQFVSSLSDCHINYFENHYSSISPNRARQGAKIIEKIGCIQGGALISSE